MVLLCSATVCANCRSNAVIVVLLFLNLLPIRRDKDTKNYTNFELFLVNNEIFRIFAAIVK